jgi:hypothetical protein
MTAFQAEKMSSQDAYMFPVIGSCTLFGLYLIFKYFEPQYVNMLLSAYFAVFGTSFSQGDMLVCIFFFFFFYERLDASETGRLFNHLRFRRSLVGGYFVRSSARDLPRWQENAKA